MDPCIGIVAEKSSRWERRVPLSPRQCAELVSAGCRVLIQPSNIRAFRNEEYEAAGAVLQNDLSPANLILSIKDVPADEIIPGKTYMFFSHTMKGQSYSMHLLDSLLEKRIRLIDYEKLKDASGQRLVRFGRHGGMAAMVDTLHCMGDRLLYDGYTTPFLHLSMARHYMSLNDAKDAIRHVAQKIERFGLHPDLCPFTLVYTGSGAVAQGVKEILDLLPCKFVEPSELESLWNSKDFDTHVIYVAHVTAKDTVEPIDPSATFDKAEYYAHPERYRPVFHQKILPFTRVLVNGQYWDSRFPRLVTLPQGKELVRTGRFHTLAIADIACDPKGAVEFFVKSTTMDDPVYTYDISDGIVHDGMTGPGVLFIGLSSFAAEFPRESSDSFGESLMPFVEKLARSDNSLPFEKQDVPETLRKACICCNGELTPAYKYISSLRMRADAKTHILVLGAGHIAQPAVEYLLKMPQNVITVASLFVSDAQRVCQPYKGRASPLQVDVTNHEALRSLVQSHDIVISLVPPALHHHVLNVCVAEKRDMVTASYSSPEVQALHSSVQDAGALCMMECGLDPGLDHFIALEAIGEVEKLGGKVTSLKSLCGALPAPECSNNPLLYKFSWSAHGFITAAASTMSKYLWENREIDIPGQLKHDLAFPVNLSPAFAFEAVPNRDCLRYGPLYGIEPHTLLRASLRYRGHSNMMRAFSVLGLLDMSKREDINCLTWARVLRHNIGCPESSDLLSAVRSKLAEGFQERAEQVKPLVTSAGSTKKVNFGDDAQAALEGLSQLGLFSDSLCVPIEDREHNITSVAEALGRHLFNTLGGYADDERDLVFLHQEIKSVFPDTGREETRLSTLAVYGDTNPTKLPVTTFSATSKTTGLTVAVVGQMVLDGLVKNKGVCSPMDVQAADKTFCLAVLERLRDAGVNVHERSILL